MCLRWLELHLMMGSRGQVGIENDVIHQPSILVHQLMWPFCFVFGSLLMVCKGSVLVNIWFRSSRTLRDCFSMAFGLTLVKVWGRLFLTGDGGLTNHHLYIQNLVSRAGGRPSDFAKFHSDLTELHYKGVKASDSTPLAISLWEWGILHPMSLLQLNSARK